MGVFFVTVVVLTLIAVRTLRAVRDAQRMLTVAGGGLSDRLETMQERLMHVSERRERVEQSLAAVERSRRKVDVLMWALEDVRGFFTRARGTVPRK
jgi:hypothetical protein